MKITTLYVYPIKGLRPLELKEARLGPQGVEHDRRFMLYSVDDLENPTKLSKIQIDKNPECGLFEQTIVGDNIKVRYLTPKEPIVPSHPLQNEVLEVPLRPETDDLDTIDVDLHLSMVTAHRMGKKYDDWFTACFGIKIIMVYIGEGRRPVLGTFAPGSKEANQPQQRGWLSSISSFVTGNGDSAEERPWIAFSDLAPYLVASEKSVANVTARLPEGNNVPMYKFRPNIVVDGEAEFDEDFWAELAIGDDPVFTMTKMCNRCTSLNADYETGRTAKGDMGNVLKKLMLDRRVDKGMPYSPVFGKYGFLKKGLEGRVITVGDEVTVTKRADDRPVFDWPLRNKNGKPQFYQAS